MSEVQNTKRFCRSSRKTRIRARANRARDVTMATETSRLTFMCTSAISVDEGGEEAEAAADAESDAERARPRFCRSNAIIAFSSSIATNTSSWISRSDARHAGT